MRGRPGGVKSELAKFDGGSKAVMRSAFLRGNMAAGPDGFREQHPNTTAAYCMPRIFADFVARRFDRSSSLALP
ncbi:MAG TPA: hypothetical protein PK677_15470, partial [Acidiphilium sp.]|nr:hypothetical protein [Acidiphilium sp.]